MSFAETFVEEGPRKADTPGSHWNPFFKGGAREALLGIPEYVNAGLRQAGYGTFYPAPNKVPDHWAQGLIYAWPIRDEGIQTIVRTDREANRVKAAFPFSALGTQHTIRLDQVRVHENRVQAQIEGALGPVLITFFDTRYLIDRAWYRAGQSYEFILCGLAYDCRRAAAKQFKIRHSRKVLAALRSKFWPDADRVMNVTTAGMAVLLPIAEWDRDDWQFRGPIKSVKETQFLDQPAWRLRVTVVRLDDDIDLEILVSARAWKSRGAPVVGEDVEGALWLQGTLWDARSARITTPA